MRKWIVSGLVLLSMSGCGGGGRVSVPPSAAPDPSAVPQPGKPTTPQQPSAVQASSTGVHIPEDARFTIECARYIGSDHVQQSRLIKDQMIRTTGRNDFYVQHHEGYSVLYLGYYKTIDRLVDSREAQRSSDDLSMLEKIRLPSGVKMFPRALKVPIETANPEAPDEWDLAKLDADKPANDPDRRFWTIVIAAYTNDVLDENGQPGDRKRMAVESVKAARAQGVEAYFYHGESMSQVCVGAWPRRAIREQEMASAESRSEAKANSGEALVVSPAPLPESFAQQLEQSHAVKVVQPKVVIQDPSLAQAIKYWEQFPYSVNSVAQQVTVTDPVTRKKVVRDQPPFLSQIPQVQKTLIRHPPSESEPSPTMINPLKPGTTDGLRRMER